MDLPPIGSNTLLEISADEVHIVIKSKKNRQITGTDCLSSLVVEGEHIQRISIQAVGVTDEVNADSSRHDYQIPPIFFEQTDYEIVIKSRSNRALSFWNENYAIRQSISQIFEGDPTALSGVINFDNLAGYSEFEILVDGASYLKFTIEVFPSKISYKQDYQEMINDISEMVCEAALEFMAKTYERFSLGDKNSSALAVYFQILRTIFDDYLKAVNRIIAVPHHKLITEREVVAGHKLKRTDHATEKWLLKHHEYVRFDGGRLQVEKALTAKKQITYDTSENRFVKYILKSTVTKLQEFIKRYQRSTKTTEAKVLQDAGEMLQTVRRVLNSSFLHDVTEYSATQSMSLVFGMAPGYRELYKCYIMLKKSLSIHGDIFKMSVKDTALLYEYWCFVKLFSLLKKEYQLKTPDIIKADYNGITVNLKQGKTSKAKFFIPETNETITLIYNPSESHTQTVNQRPDNVLELEKHGSSINYKYVFDAKYKIEGEPDSQFYPDSKPGPKVDDINTMHRYRDSIVYENQESRFMFEKTMFGAYILFPYDNEEEYKDHRFYKSISTVNIGGLPFLPGATKLVEKLLTELIQDSKESAFERASLPYGIDEKLKRVDWNKRDVLIGTFRNIEQFELCFENKFYYVPCKQFDESKLPIHYVALYQTNKMFNEKGQIKYYGESIRVERVKRRDITEVPVRRNNGDESYYRITVREWKDLTLSNETGKVIRPKESGFVTEFTNLFLLEHSEYVQELLIKTEEEYRFYTELKRGAKAAEIEGDDSNIGFVREGFGVHFSNGEIVVVDNTQNKIIAQKEIAEFAKRPAQTFRILQYAMNNVNV